MNFARPIRTVAVTVQPGRTLKNLEFSVGRLTQEVIIARKRLEFLEAQLRYEEMNLAEARGPRHRPMAIVRAPRPEPKAERKAPSGPRQPRQMAWEARFETIADEIWNTP